MTYIAFIFSDEDFFWSQIRPNNVNGDRWVTHQWYRGHKCSCTTRLPLKQLATSNCSFFCKIRYFPNVSWSLVANPDSYKDCSKSLGIVVTIMERKSLGPRCCDFCSQLYVTSSQLLCMSCLCILSLKVQIVGRKSFDSGVAPVDLMSITPLGKGQDTH